MAKPIDQPTLPNLPPQALPPVPTPPARPDPRGGRPLWSEQQIQTALAQRKAHNAQGPATEEQKQAMLDGYERYLRLTYGE
jgi:hypothetical protein